MPSSSSSSSQSLAPLAGTRRCVRLAEPADNTIEQIGDGNLILYIDVPYSLLRAYAPNFPSAGPDIVTCSYVDGLGQQSQLTINCWLTMSDNGYVIISADQGTQFLIASINASFWQANAIAINTRNANAAFPALMPCSNASRYDYPVLLPNQEIPALWIRDGVTLNDESSSSPTIV